MNDKRNFNDLYAFIQVVQAGNFSRAAKTLDVQPSALSHRIGALEARLGVKLLHRTTRAMSPTEAGQQLFERTAPLFDGISRETVSPASCASTPPKTPPIISSIRKSAISCAAIPTFPLKS